MDTYNSNNLDFLQELKEFIQENPIDYKDLIFDPSLSSEEAKKRNSEIVECDRCGVKGNYPNMMRWHFAKCSVVLKECKQCGSIIPRQGVKEYLYKNKHYCNRKCYMNSKKGKPFIEMTQEIKDKLSLAQKLHYGRLKSNQIK